MAHLVADPPDEIVLAAHWPLYDWSTLPATIDRLAKAGIRHIVVVGPVPEWTKSLPVLLSGPASDPTGSEGIPQRQVAGLNPRTKILDTRLGDALKPLPVTYVSMLALMCNTQGCLVRTGDAASSITAWDSTHLTSDGSIYAVAHFPPSAFPSHP